MSTLPNKIRHYRELRGMSQEKLGLLLNKKKDTISKWERGERGIGFEEAKKISEVLGVTIDQLNSGDDSEYKIYKADEDLMSKSSEAVRKAIASNNSKVSLEKAMAVTVHLYNHVIQYRQKGEATEPTESIAALLLNQNP